MVNYIFKAIFAVIGIATVFLLFKIEAKLGNQRYQRQGGATIDTRTGIGYHRDPDGGFRYMDERNRLVKVKSLPTD